MLMIIRFLLWWDAYIIIEELHVQALPKFPKLVVFVKLTRLTSVSP
jgi:hypothetical protein